jgi:hypothetical protein
MADKSKQKKGKATFRSVTLPEKQWERFDQLAKENYLDTGTKYAAVILKKFLAEEGNAK